MFVLNPWKSTVLLNTGEQRSETYRGVKWRAAIGYGPLIIEFAGVMMNGVVLALNRAHGFYKAT